MWSLPKKLNLFDLSIDHDCTYCEYFVKNICSFGLTIDNYGLCSKFLYAPLKRIPKPYPKPSGLYPEDFTL